MRPPHTARKPIPIPAPALAILILLCAVFLWGGAALAQDAEAGLKAPQNPAASLIIPQEGYAQVRIAWDNPDDQGVTGYVINRSDGKEFNSPGQATTYTDHGTEPGTTYTYTVSAESAGGAGPASEAASVRVPDRPAEPGSFSSETRTPEALHENVWVTLEWQAAPGPETEACEESYPVTGYLLTRIDIDGTTDFTVLPVESRSHTDETAEFSSVYTYLIIAINRIGASHAPVAVINTPARPVMPPTGLTAKVADTFDGNVTLSWDAPTEGPHVVSYLVLRHDGTSSPLQGTAPPTTLDEMTTQTTLVDATAQAGVTYTYTVQARSADNISEPSEAAAMEAPAPPSRLTATPGDGAINLSWPAPAAGTVSGYRIARQQQGGEWATLADVTETSHRDGAAQANVQYRYRVQHRNQYGGSTWSESGPVTLVTLPGAPTGLTATVDGNDNALSWTAPGSPFIDGYRVRRRTGDGDWRALAQDITDTGYRHENAQADVTHSYAVQAYNQAGDSPWSGPASATRVTPPAAPQNVSAEIDGDDIVLTWERPRTAHVSGYTVRHQEGGADAEESQRLPESQTSFRLKDTTGDAAYRIAVRSHNDAGDSPWSGDVEIMRRLAPSVPTGFAVTVGESDIVLSWDAPKTGAADGYHVEYGEQDSEQLQTENLDAAQTSYTHSDNAEGVTYRYRVRAHNTAGESQWSETLTASRTLEPAAPAELTAEVSGSAITVSWTAPATGAVDTYQVRYGVSGSDETESASVDSTETSFTHLGAKGDTAHSYQVRSVNSAGSSPWAGPVTAMWVIPPGVPTGVTAAISGDDILVSWTRPAGNFIDEYRVQFREQNTGRWNSAAVAATRTSHRHTGPTPGTTHEYRVRAENAGGVSQWSKIATGVWYRTAAPPRKFILTPFGAKLLVQWPKSETPDVTGYQLRYRIDSGEWQYQDTTLLLYFADWSTGQTLHEYQIRALKDDNAGDWSAIHRATVATPAAALALTLNREGASGVRLHWTEPASGPPARYIIEGRWRDKTKYSTIAGTGGHITTVHIGIGHDREYTFRVLAQNHFGIRGPHQEGVTAHIVIPAAESQSENAPQNLEARMLDPATIKLTWAPPQERAGQVTNYRIYRKPVSDTRRMGDSYRDHVLAAYTSGASTSHIDHGAKTGVAYEYAVAAYRDGYPNPWSSISHRAYARPWE